MFWGRKLLLSVSGDEMKVLLCVFLVLLATQGVAGQTTILTGRIYDANGAVIVGATVNAVDSNAQIRKSVTNESGIFELILPYQKYEPGSKFKISIYKVSPRRQIS